MSLMIFRFWTATVLAFLKNGLKLLNYFVTEIYCRGCGEKASFLAIL